MNNLDNLTERIDRFTEKVNALKGIDPFRKDSVVTYDDTFKEFEFSIESLKINAYTMFYVYTNGIKNDIEQFYYVFYNYNRLRDASNLILRSFRDMSNDLRRFRAKYYLRSNLSDDLLNALNDIYKEFPTFDKAVEELMFVYLPDYERLKINSTLLVKDSVKNLRHQMDAMLHDIVQQANLYKVIDSIDELN